MSLSFFTFAMQAIFIIILCNHSSGRNENKKRISVRLDALPIHFRFTFISRPDESESKLKGVAGKPNGVRNMRETRCKS